MAGVSIGASVKSPDGNGFRRPAGRYPFDPLRARLGTASATGDSALSPPSWYATITE